MRHHDTFKNMYIPSYLNHIYLYNIIIICTHNILHEDVNGRIISVNNHFSSKRCLIARRYIMVYLCTFNDDQSLTTCICMMSIPRIPLVSQVSTIFTPSPRLAVRRAAPENCDAPQRSKKSRLR